MCKARRQRNESKPSHLIFVQPLDMKSSRCYKCSEPVLNLKIQSWVRKNKDRIEKNQAKISL